MSTSILLTNLGTPTAPTTSAVRKYLAEFLSDKRVIELPRCIWWPLLYGVVLPTRASASAKLYQKIWTSTGSPLLQIARQQAEGLQRLLAETYQLPIKVALGMRYGQPSIATALTELRDQGSSKIIVLPLYPQYSAATVGSTVDAIARTLKTWRFLPALQIINQYCEDSGYIAALVNSIQRAWQITRPAEHLLFSFHGLPKRSILKGDPYASMCHKTAHKVAAALDYPSNQWSIVFQSRFGWQKWLEPYCDKTLQQLARRGVKTVDVICPGFSADCLETLEEIAQRNRAIYLQAGGTTFNYIPALNDHPDHLQALADIVLPWVK